MGCLDVNSILIDPVHVHMKQLYDCSLILMGSYNSYAFFPSITYYRKCEVDVGKLNGHLTTQALNLAINDIDNWLFNFDAVHHGDSIQSQYVAFVFDTHFKLGQLMISVNSVSLFSNYYACEDIDTIFISMVYDEQYFSTKNKASEEVKIKKNSASKQIYDIKTIQAFNVYNVNRTFYVYLYVVTKDSFQKCVGVAKIDNLALQVINNRQRHEPSKNDEDVFSILFFPNSHHDSSANNAIAETTVKCTYNPSVRSLILIECRNSTFMKRHPMSLFVLIVVFSTMKKNSLKAIRI